MTRRHTTGRNGPGVVLVSACVVAQLVARVVAIVVAITLLLAAPIQPAALARAAQLKDSTSAGGLPQNILRLWDSGEYSQAAQELKTAIAANPQDSMLPYWLGRCFYQMNDFTGAISSFESAIALDPNRADFHDWLGKACGRKAEEQGHANPFAGFNLARRTRHEFETAVRLDARNIDAQRDFIRYLAIAPGIVGGSEERAQMQINMLADIDPLQAQLARADVYAAHKKFDLAGTEYKKVLAAAPKRMDVYFEIADYFRDHNDAPAMQQAVDLAAKLAPSDRRLGYYRGVALVLAGKDLPQAEGYLRGYLEKPGPASEGATLSSAHEWLGKLYADENKPDKADAENQAALELDPRNKDARDALKRAQDRNRK